MFFRRKKQEAFGKYQVEEWHSTDAQASREPTLRSKLQRGSSTQILGALAPVATPLRDEHTILGQRKEHGVHVKGHNSKYEKLESGQREMIGSLT